MKLLDNVFVFIKTLDEKKFLKYTYIILIIISLFSGFVIYKYFSKVSSYRKELIKINRLRQEAQTILSKDIQVKKQKNTVDEIIEKGKNFKLKQYFESVVQKLGIEKNIKGDVEITPSDLENLTAQGYTEVKLTAILNEITMKQLVELLDTFEKNERIYTKHLEITKPNNNATIDVNIVIATIQPKTEVTENME